MVTNFETVGGVVTKGMTYAKLLDHLREVQECCYTMAHLHRTEDTDKDAALAGMWLAAGEAFKVHQQKITQMAMGRMS
jgi:hypothetical protein